MLNFLYVSTLCSDDLFSRIFSESSVKPQQQAQKFHSLLARGLVEAGASVRALSRPPIDSVVSSSFASSNDVDGCGIHFEYLFPARFALIRHLALFWRSFFSALLWGSQRRTGRKIVVCDVLNFSITAGALLAALFCRVKTVAVVTDLPGFLNFSRQERGWRKIKRSLYQWLSEYLIGRYDYYLVLTEDINGVVNKKGRPHVVIEGMVDFKMADVVNVLEEKHAEKVVIYAGALYEKFGVGKLIEAFSHVDGREYRLWLYGAGDMEPEICRAAAKDPRIVYFGVVPNPVVVNQQLKATLLVNPRPSDEEFTKYSFPSKNMECMASGTPLLTTPLPGMPKEYEPFVFLFEDESVEGMAAELSRVLSFPRSQLHEMGAKSKKFVIDKKNNRQQAVVLIEMIQRS